MASTPSLQKMLSFRRACQGKNLALLVSDNSVSLYAWRMALAFAKPGVDTIHVVMCVPTEESRTFGKNFLSQYVSKEHFVTRTLLVKQEVPLMEVIIEHLQGIGADLVVLGTMNLSRTDAKEMYPIKMRFGSFTMRFMRAFMSAPVLIVKLTTKGLYARQSSTSLGVKCMVELQPHSRHLLAWLMDHLNSEKDSLYLAVTRAFDATGQKKDGTTRMLSTFTVQTNTNQFYTTHRLYKVDGMKAFPQAVEVEQIDVLALQAPECGFSDYICDMLTQAQTAVLVYHHPRPRRHTADEANGSPLASPTVASQGRGRRLSLPGGVLEHSGREMEVAGNPDAESQELRAPPLSPTRLEGYRRRTTDALAMLEPVDEAGEAVLSAATSGAPDIKIDAHVEVVPIDARRRSRDQKDLPTSPIVPMRRSLDSIATGAPPLWRK